MTETAVRVPAVGGQRTVPTPDPVARDYILLALRLEQHVPGLVDGYYGPAALKAQVDMEQRRSPARLRDDAAALRARLPAEVAEPDRRLWLDAQLVALETQAAALAGDALPYLEHVTRCFDHVPAWIPDERSMTPRRGSTSSSRAMARSRTDWPRGTAGSRSRSNDCRPSSAGSSSASGRGGRAVRAARRGGPAIGLVRDQPWSAYNWFDGGRRSRIDVNTDLPARAPSLPGTIAHEAYPGHHLEHATKEAELLDRGAPRVIDPAHQHAECLISEGLADLGERFVAPPPSAPISSSSCSSARAWPPATRLGPRHRRAAAAIETHRTTLGTIGGNAALLRHAEGRSHDEVIAYLRDVGRLAPPRAEKRLEFIEHPLWRTYVFVYAEGEALLERWVDAVPEGERAARFGRLLREQLTPAAVRSPG